MADTAPKLLLVEDDPFMASLMTETFTKEGFLVVLSVDGEDAVKAAQDQNFDIAIFDILLPKKNGIEAIREIRKTPTGAKLPVIILSNIEDASYVTEAQQLGVKAYLIKANVQIPEVVMKAKQILGRN